MLCRHLVSLSSERERNNLFSIPFALLLIPPPRSNFLTTFQKRKSRPIRCCLSFFALVCCSALGAGFYGNHELHGGLEEFSKFLVQIDRHIDEAQSQVKSFSDTLQKRVELNLNNLYDGAFQTEIRQDKAAHYELMDNTDFIFHNVTLGLKAMDEIRLSIYDPKKPVDIGQIPVR